MAAGFPATGCGALGSERAGDGMASAGCGAAAGSVAAGPGGKEGVAEADGLADGNTGCGWIPVFAGGGLGAGLTSGIAEGRAGCVAATGALTGGSLDSLIVCHTQYRPTPKPNSPAPITTGRTRCHSEGGVGCSRAALRGELWRAAPLVLSSGGFCSLPSASS